MGLLDRFKKPRDSEPAGDDTGGNGSVIPEPAPHSVQDGAGSDPKTAGRPGDNTDHDSGGEGGSARRHDVPATGDDATRRDSGDAVGDAGNARRDGTEDGVGGHSVGSTNSGAAGGSDESQTSGKHRPATVTNSEVDGPAGLDATGAGALDGSDSDRDSMDGDSRGTELGPGTVDHQRELDDLERRLRDVKDEYGLSVKNLMDVKRDLNQKKGDLESAQSQLDLLQAEIDKKGELGAKASEELGEMKRDLDRIQYEISAAKKSHDALLDTLSKERHALSIVKLQQSEAEQSLEEANARLYNAREELGRQEQFQDPSPLSQGERDFIERATEPRRTNQKSDHVDVESLGADRTGPASSSSVIEAASVVVASLKSKLGMTQKELEAVQLMLEQEREQHEATRTRLAALMRGDDPDSGT